MDPQIMTSPLLLAKSGFLVQSTEQTSARLIDSHGESFGYPVNILRPFTFCQKRLPWIALVPTVSLLVNKGFCLPVSLLSSNLSSASPERRRLVPSRVKTVGHGTFSGLFLRSEGALGFFCMALDALSWLGLYEVLTCLHQWVAAFSGGLQASVCLTQFLVIVTCLFIVGGYDRRTSFMSLVYMSEHFITLLAGACLGGLAIYAGSAYGQLTHPSRGILLASQLAFAPLSLICRRYLWQMLQTRIKRGYLLVLGAGELARHLHHSNLLSSNSQCLRFVDPTPTGRPELRHSFDLESTEASAIEVLPFEQFASLLEQTSGVIIAEDTRQMSADLLEGLSRLHYQGVPVYTLETFYARYWRRVPVHAIDATWPIQLEAHLVNARAKLTR